MNLMLLLAQVAPALADSVAGANPVLTPIAAPDEMNLWSMAVKGDYGSARSTLRSVLLYSVRAQLRYP